MTSISLFDYHLPKDYIAQTPAVPRESAKLMIVDTKKEKNDHTTVSHLPEYFQKGDVVIINNTKVFNARLQAVIQTASARIIELFLVKPLLHNSTNETSSTWLCLAKPAKYITEGTNINIAQDFYGTAGKKHDDGSITVHFPYSSQDVINKANIYGTVPLPPYIKQHAKIEDYQTSYAKKTGSVAAPTAGFHMTPTIRTQLQQKGIQIEEITLHVGMGTFMPVKTEQIEDHVMHSEYVHLPPHVCTAINTAKKEKRRVIAVGTTVVRTLEGCAVQQKYNNEKELQPYIGDINLFIRPGFQFKIIDGLLTNFHLPKSTLLVLVSAFAGRQRILAAYQEAVERHYRFFSFGDCMFLF